MRATRAAGILVAVCSVVGCSVSLPPTTLPSSTLPSSTLPPSNASTAGTGTPSQAVEAFFAVLAAGRFEEVAGLVVGRHVALLTLTEDAEVPDVVAALDDETEVAVTFWASFAEGIGDVSTAGLHDLSVLSERLTVVNDQRFASVQVTLVSDQLTRRIILQQQGSWLVDPLATFSPAVASRLNNSVEVMLSDPQPGTDLVLAAFREEITSLWASMRLWPAEITGEDSGYALRRVIDLLERSGGG